MNDYHTEGSIHATSADSISIMSYLNKHSSQSTKSLDFSPICDFNGKKESANEKIHNLTNIISDLESKILVYEQNEQNLKRQNQKLQIEISELHMEINKLIIITDNIKEKDVHHNTHLNDFPNITLKESQEMLIELLAEIEELKKEKQEMMEKALNMLTEKELVIMQLRENLEELNNNQYKELNALTNNFSKNYYDNDNTNSIIEDLKHENVLLNEKINFLLEENKKTINKYEKEKNNLEKKLNQLTELNRQLSVELIEKESDEESIHILKLQEQNNKNEIYTEIEKLNTIIRNMDEKHMRIEQNLKDYNSKLLEELKELDNLNKKYKQINENSEKEKTKILDEYTLKINNITEHYKVQYSQKEKDYNNISNKFDILQKEKNAILNEFEQYKKNNEISKESYFNLQNDLQIIKENYEKEKKNLEEKIINKENTFECEKEKLLDQINFLQLSLTNSHNFQKRRSTMNLIDDYQANLSLTNCSILSEVLELENDSSPEMKIIELESQIKYLENQLNENRLKVNILSKKEKENELLKLENINLKENMNKLKDLYENQIKTTQKVNLILNTELKHHKIPHDNLLLNTQNIDEEYTELKIKINNLELDLEAKNSLLEKERKMFNLEIEKLSDELSELKVKLAELNFEKDSDKIKFKREFKLIKTDLENHKALVAKMKKDNTKK
jgi:hypothetical protein